MSKVICDICGTVYQDTAECCPICGCARGTNTEIASEDLFLDEELDDSASIAGKRGRFASSNVKKKKKEIFDFDAMNSQDDTEKEKSEEADEDILDDEDGEDGEPRTNTFLVVLLTILIVLLLLATGFILFRYFLPNVISRDNDAVDTAGSTQATQERIEETTEPAIPCQSIVLLEGIPELNKDGKWLLHVVVMPEDTTDTLVYESADESIVTVNEEGRITAINEGETTIYITCGMQQINCKVVVHFVEETEPPTEEPVQTEPEETIEATVADEPVEEIKSEPEKTAEETKPLEAMANVALKLKQTDVTITVGYSFQLELDCDLKPEDVEWSVEHEYIAKVDDGYVTALCAGTTAVIVKYGDQQVQCIVRCRAR